MRLRKNNSLNTRTGAAPFSTPLPLKWQTHFAPPSLRLRAGMCGLVAFSMMAGCKSSMPTLNRFGFKSEPSPEAIAGVGPTATYPVSPSSNVAPEAIASTAAGAAAPSGVKPQTSGLASTSPNFGGSSPTNPAAAIANGFPGAGNTAPSSVKGVTNGTPASLASTSPSGTTGGFTYGQNPNAGRTSPNGIAAIPAGYTPNRPASGPGALPGYAQTAPAAAPSTQSPVTPAYTAVPGYPLPGSTTPSPSPAQVASMSPSVPPSFAAPAAAPMATQASAAATAPPATSTAGFTMPPSASPVAAPSTAPAVGFTMPGAATAPAATVATAPTGSRMTAPTAPSTSTGSYKPGSTAGAVGYPSGDLPSTSNDSFYR